MERRNLNIEELRQIRMSSSGSKCEELGLSNTSPLPPTKRTSMRRFATSLMGQQPTLGAAPQWGKSGKMMTGIALATRAGADRG
jgi:hypothetical protein